MNFLNKVVLITGGGSGIGAATAVAFAKHGADVAIAGRREKNLQEVASLCDKFGKKSLIIKADIAKDEEAKNVVTRTIQHFGKLDILINNAATIKYDGNILDGTIMKSYDEIMNTNTRSCVYITTLAAPHLIKTRGNIVNISSVAALTTPKTYIPISYAMSKDALNIFSKGAARELAAHGVRVNVISPGATRTEMLQQAERDISLTTDKKMTIPLNRISEPEEMADLILYLASDKAKGITGSNFVSDNGFLLTC